MSEPNGGLAAYRTIEVHNAATRYIAHVFSRGGVILIAVVTYGNHGEWVQLAWEEDREIAWSYLVEKMPSIAKYEGDKPGWVKAFAAAGIEVFG